jgi:hypothetical protein
MKKVLFLIAAMFLATALLQAENADKIRLANGNMLYYKVDMWQGLMVASERYPKGYSIYSEDFKKLIKRVPACYQAYQESESKKMLGIIVAAGSSLAGVGIMYLGIQSSFSSSGPTSINYPLMFGGVLVAGVGEIIGYMFINDSNNLFFKAIHEYNKAMIYVGMRDQGTVGIQKSIDF